MSIAENAQLLISSANGYVEDAIGVANSAGSALVVATSGIAQVRQLTEGIVASSSYTLGSGHPGTGTIMGSANTVISEVDSMLGIIQQLQNSILTLNHAITTHGNTVGSVGHQLLQGGS